MASRNRHLKRLAQRSGVAHDAVKKFAVEGWSHATSRVCTDPSPHKAVTAKPSPGLVGKPHCAAINLCWTVDVLFGKHPAFSLLPHP